MLHTVVFTPLKGGTEMSLEARVMSVTADSPRYLAGMSQGWSQSMDRLTDLMARVEGRVAVG